MSEETVQLSNHKRHKMMEKGFGGMVPPTSTNTVLRQNVRTMQKTFGASSLEQMLDLGMNLDAATKHQLYLSGAFSERPGAIYRA